MKVELPEGAMRQIAQASDEEQERLFDNVTVADMLSLDADFEEWAHKAQLPPNESGWRTWLMMAGRGFGKTRAGAEWIEKLALCRPGVRIALVGATIDEARRVMVEGVSGILSVAKRRRHRVKWEPSIGRLSWRNGSEAQIFSGDNPEGLRGPEHDFAWFFTFEVIADEGPASVVAALSETSGGLVQAASERTLLGFAAYGDTIAAAIEPVVTALGIDLVDKGHVLDAAGTEFWSYDPMDAGCSPDGSKMPRLERSQVPAAALPSTLNLAYYDRDRDYQSNIARASLDASGHSTERLDLPAVIDVAAAKGLAETALAKRWSERDRMTVRLPQAYLGLRPGARLQSSGDKQAWKARRVTLESMTTVVELSPAFDDAPPMAGDAGRIVPSIPAIPVPTSVMLAELPDDGLGSGDRPVVAIAATGSSNSIPLQIEVGTAAYTLRAASAGTIVGTALSVLAPGQSALLDLANQVDVQLADDRGWLESCDLDALASGRNLALLGDELLQFGSALPLGGNSFRLSRLLRGRAGTEWGMGGHSVGARFILLDRSRLEFVPLTVAQMEAVLKVTPCGLADANAHAVELTITGEALRPPSPAHVRAAFDAGQNLTCTWVRRSRGGWSWLDGVDAPLGCSTELYRVTLSGDGGSVVTETAVPQARFEAAEIDGLGTGNLELSVVQVGDFAVSRPAFRTIERS